MIERGPARECDVVIAFLQAEISSSRYSEKCILPLLHLNRLSREDLIEHPDLGSEFDNGIRRMLLQAYRGFGANMLLFRGFPTDAVWRFVEIEPKDHQLLLFAKEDSWKKLSEGTRSVERLARRIARLEEGSDTADRVRAIQQDLTDGKSMAPLILVEGENKALVLVEGHSRATAYVGFNWYSRQRCTIGTTTKTCLQQEEEGRSRRGRCGGVQKRQLPCSLPSTIDYHGTQNAKGRFEVLPRSAHGCGGLQRTERASRAFSDRTIASRCLAHVSQDLREIALKELLAHLNQS